MICLNCGFWKGFERVNLDHILYTSDPPSYLLKPRGRCKEEGIVTCYDEGCERFENKLQEV